MPSTTDGGKNSGLGGGPDCSLHIAYIQAARDEAGPARYHAVPDGPRVLVAVIGGAQQIAFESPVERGVNLFAGLDQFGVPVPKCPFPLIETLRYCVLC